MLYMLGGVAFEVAGLNAERVSRESQSEFATYNVVGAEPLYEFMGEGERKITISGKVFPFALGGGPSLSQLEALRQAGMPTSLVRGDGGGLAWVIIESMREKHGHLYFSGAPQEVEHEVCLVRCDAPSAGGMGMFLSLF